MLGHRIFTEFYSTPLCFFPDLSSRREEDGHEIKGRCFAVGPLSSLRDMSLFPSRRKAKGLELWMVVLVILALVSFEQETSCLSIYLGLFPQFGG